MKKWLNKKGGLAWGHNLGVFYYFSASEIMPDKVVVFGGRGLIRGGLMNQETELKSR